MYRILIFIGIVMCSVFAMAQSAEKGESICYEVQNYVNILVDSTNTSCIPNIGKEDSLSFIVISSEPVFSIPTAKTAWLLAVVGAVGKTLNDQPSTKVDELWLSDLNHTRNHVAFILPLSLVKSLQAEVSNGHIDVEDMYLKIQKNLVKKTIQNK